MSSQVIGRSLDKVMAAAKWLVVMFYGVRSHRIDYIMYRNVHSCIKWIFHGSCSDLAGVPASLLAARAHEDVRNHLGEGKQLPINTYSLTQMQNNINRKITSSIERNWWKNIFFSFENNQLEKLEAAKAAVLVWISLLSLTGSFLVLLGLDLTWPYWALLSFTYSLTGIFIAFA